VLLPPGRFEKMNLLRAILAILLMIPKAHTFSRKLMDYLYLRGMLTITEIAGTVLVNLYWYLIIGLLIGSSMEAEEKLM